MKTLEEKIEEILDGWENYKEKHYYESESVDVMEYLKHTYSEIVAINLRYFIQSSILSDAEIEETAFDKKNEQNPYMFKNGARWMRDQIVNKLKSE